MMKKIYAIIVLNIFFSISFPQPSAALMLDAGQILAEANEIIGSIQEWSSKITSYSTYGKEQAAFGLDYEQHIATGKKFLSSKAIPYIKGKLFKKSKAKKTVGSTQQKNLEQLEKEKEIYEKSVKEEYAEKLKIAKDNLTETSKKLAETTQQIAVKKADVEMRKKAYEEAKKEGGALGLAVSSLYELYSKALSELETLERSKEELVESIKKQTEIIAKLEMESLKMATMEDPKYKAFMNRIKAMKSKKDDESIVEGEVSSSQNEDWATKGDMSGFEIKEEDYEKFLERYFYDPTNLTVEAETEQLKFQSSADKVTRERRFLLVNSAAHLLQVSASARREIPVRAESAKAYFDTAKKGSGELEAIISYTTLRLENIKAMLLYARLLSAKLQYMAAHDLLNENLQKVWQGKNYEKFDLEKYILTDEDVKKRIEEANDTSLFNEMMNISTDEE